MTTTAIDVSGQRFGRLVALRRAPRRIAKKQRAYWVCQCDCGNQHIVEGSHLRGGRIKSCGCWHKEAAVINNLVHGESFTRNYSTEYRSWLMAKNRCNNPNYVNWENYGGRGIRMCKEWSDSYPTFLSDMGRKPHPEYSIDRIDVNGNYTPDNCRWADKTTQSRNRRCCHG